MYPETTQNARFNPTSRWGQNIEDIYRRTNKNLTSGVYLNPSIDFYTKEKSNISSSKRLEDVSYHYQQPSVTSQ